MATLSHSVWRESARWMVRLGRNERPLLLMILTLSLGAWGFVALADLVMEGETHSMDTHLLLSMRAADNPSEPWGPEWVHEMARDLTGLGGTAILTGLSLAAVGYLALIRKFHLMTFLIVAIGGGIVVSTLLKLGFDRPRPDLVPHGSHVYTKSFPSGHSMMAAVTYLTLGALLARIQRRRSQRAYILIIACLATLAVGASRVYLGVHWPTDVLAGWAVGSAWAAACWTVANLMQRRGDIEGTPSS